MRQLLRLRVRLSILDRKWSWDLRLPRKPKTKVQMVTRMNGQHLHFEQWPPPPDDPRWTALQDHARSFWPEQNRSRL